MVLTGIVNTARIHVKDQSYTGQARRTAKAFAESLGFAGTALDNLSILVSEIASNLAKHTDTGGELILCNGSADDAKAIRLLAIDKGPGIADIENCLIDGNSTSGTLGAGLGTLQRLSDFFEISSRPGAGTVVHCYLSDTPKPKRKHSNRNEFFDIGLLTAPHPVETCCGDAVASASADQLLSILLVDGLGHGQEAAEAAEKACASFLKSPFDEPLLLVKRIHLELSGTRGAALALAQISQESGKLNFAGVGNISARIYTRYTNKGCASVPGIIGQEIASLKTYEYDWEAGAALLMFTDGIRSSAQLHSSAIQSATLCAGEIYRDFSRGSDDSSVIVVKDKRSR